jgi:hypothetical protein
MAYTPEEVDKGLSYLAACGRNSVRAHKQLVEDGHEWAEGEQFDRTLRRWRLENLDRYNELWSEQQEMIYESGAETLFDLFQRTAELHGLTLDKYEDVLKGDDTGKVRDIAGAIGNLSKANSLSLDQAAKLQGRPVAAIELRAPGEVFSELARMHPGAFIDVDSEEDDREVAALPPG